MERVLRARLVLVPALVALGLVAPSAQGMVSTTAVAAQAAPAITALSVTHASVGQTVTLTGTNFDGATGVTLGGLNTSYTVHSPTQITATVPDPGVNQARWRVSNPAGTGTYDPLFTIDRAVLPAISSLSVTHASVGQRITLTGTGFTAVTAVTLGGLNTSYTVDSP